MTWAVFILYAYDHYEKSDFEIISQKTVELITQNRKFVLFEEFIDLPCS
jgi:hypothetical protein